MSINILLPDSSQLSSELPSWLRLAIADAVVIFGRIEQQLIEIFWTVEDADDPKQRNKRTRAPATANFIEVIESIENVHSGFEFPDIKIGFERLAQDRNLIVHGSWGMRGDEPVIVWHKFEREKDTVPAKRFPRRRFDYFMAKADHLLNMLRQLHGVMDKQANKIRRHQ